MIEEKSPMSPRESWLVGAISPLSSIDVYKRQGLERESVALRVEQDAGEDGKRRARRHAFEHDHECVLEFRLVDAEFQGWSLLRGSFDAGVPCRTGGLACTQARRRFTWLWRPMRAVCDAHRIRETIIQALRGNALHGSVFAQRRQEK